MIKLTDEQKAIANALHKLPFLRAPETLDVIQEIANAITNEGEHRFVFIETCLRIGD